MSSKKPTIYDEYDPWTTYDPEPVPLRVVPRTPKRKSKLVKGARERLNTAEAAEYIRCSASLLNKLRIWGGGPRFIKIGNKVLYDVRDLDAWLEQRKQKSTSDVAVLPVRRRRRSRG